jgi:hypothetical protein
MTEFGSHCGRYRYLLQGARLGRRSAASLFAPMR